MASPKKVDNMAQHDVEPVSTPSEEQVNEVIVSDVEPVSTPSEIKTIEVIFKTEQPIINNNDVLVEINYPVDFVGKKWFKNGDIITTSKESAELFKSQKIGKII